MSEEHFDLEEIIAEIKSDHPNKKNDVVSVNHDEAKSSRRAKPAENNSKHKKIKKAKTSNNVSASSSDNSKKGNKKDEITPTVNDEPQLFAKELDNLFSDDLPRKKKSAPKRRQAEIIEIKDLTKTQDDSKFDSISSSEEDHKTLPYDMLNRVYSDPEEAVVAFTKKLRASSLNLILLFPIWLIAIYMTLTFPLGLPMPPWFSYFKTPFLYLLVFFVADAAALMLASDVSVSGLARLIKGKPTLDTLVLFASIASMAYTLTVIIKPSWGGWIPFTANTVSMCFFALASKRRRYITLKRMYRVLQQDSSPVAVKAQGPRRYKTAYKTGRNVFPEMENLASRDHTERLCSYYTPLIMLICIALAVAASFGRQDTHSFTWCLSALTVMSVSPALIISSSLPTSIISRRLFTSGSAVVNSKAASELSRCRNAVITDADIFPNGSITITSLNIDKSFEFKEVYGIMASALEVIGGGLYNVFDDAAKQMYSERYDVEDIRFFENGGMSAKINNDFILIGTASFLRRMGVHIDRVRLQNCLFVSVNSKYAGVFSLKYTAQTPVYCAFRHLRRTKATPVLAVRDFTTTQAFIEDTFKLHAEEAEYPSMEDRVKYSDDRFADSDPLAVLSHSNMSSFAELLLACRKLTRSVTFNLICSFMGCIVGILIMYFLVSNMEVSAASPFNVLIYLGCWAMPVWLSSLIFTTF